MSPMLKAGVFLVEALFDLYLFALLLRFIFQVVRADFFNPLSQLVVKVTNPPLIPLRRVIPGFKGLDMACLMVIVLVSLLKLLCLFGLMTQKLPYFPGLFIWAIGDILGTTINVFFFAILIQVILSWVSPHGQQPMHSILSQVTKPIMQPFRRIIPMIGGFDISPIFAILLLQVLGLLNNEYIVAQGKMLSLS